MILALLLGCAPEAPEVACARCPECSEADATACHELGEKAAVATPVDLVGAANFYKLACDAGRQRSCVAYGLKLQDGLGVPDDDLAAKRVYEAACASGDGVGCYNVAVMYDGGFGVVRDPAAAEVWFQKAHDAYAAQCAAGNLEACSNGAFQDRKGRDPAAAAAENERLCGLGWQDACANHGQDQLQTDRAAGMATLAATCEKDNRYACAALGDTKLFSTPPDMSGMADLEKSCGLGLGLACGELAGIVGDGTFAPADPAKADGYLERACDLADPKSCRLRGQVSATPADATPWFVRGCDMGDGPSCGFLGRIYLEGEAPDLAAALAAFTDACQLGELGACAPLLVSGQQLPIPDEMKPRAIDMACEAGFAAACPKPVP